MPAGTPLTARDNMYGACVLAESEKIIGLDSISKQIYVWSYFGLNQSFESTAL